MKNKIYFILLFSFGFNTFFIGSTIINKHFPYYYLAVTYRTVQNYINNILLNEVELSEKIENSQVNINNDDLKDKSIESHFLPLKLQYIDLSRYGFPSVGGSISTYKNGLIILDRLGNLYKFCDSLHKTNIKIKNNLPLFLKAYRGQKYLSTNTLRAFKVLTDEKSKKIYVSYSRFEKNDKISIVISSIDFDDFDNDKNIWEDIWTSNHFSGVAHATQSGGGAINISNNNLFVSLGFSQDETETVNEGSGLIYKIDLNNKKSKIFSSGHRNVQGMDFVNEKYLFSTEHGPQGGDEINLIENSKDYGWPNHSFGTKYGSFENYLNNQNKEIQLPLFSFIPSIGISTIKQIRNFHPLWKDNLLIGSLKSMTLKRLFLEDNKIIYDEDIFIGDRIRDFTELMNQIYILSDNSYLIKISVDEVKLVRGLKDSDDLNQANIFLKKCISCHSFKIGVDNSFGPNLANLKNRTIGSSDYKYTDVLISSQKKWTKENLLKYLKNPNGFLPGTSMPNPNLSEEELIEIVSYLTK